MKTRAMAVLMTLLAGCGETSGGDPAGDETKEAPSTTAEPGGQTESLGSGPIATTGRRLGRAARLDENAVSA